MRTRLLSAVFVTGLLAASQVMAFDYGPFSFHGTFSQGYMKSTENNYIPGSEDGGSWDLREYGLNAMWKTPVDKLRVGAQVFAREYGAVGNDQVYFDWGYFDYRATDWIGIRLGRQKIPLGLYNETRDIDALRTEAFLPQGVYTEMQREVFNSCDSVSIYGDVPLKSVGGLSYMVQYGYRVMDTENGDMAHILASAAIDVRDYDVDPSLAVEVVWETPLQGLRIGGTYSKLSYVMEADMDLAAVMKSSSVALGGGAGGPPAGVGGGLGMFMPTSVSLTVDTDKQDCWTVSAEYVRGNLTVASEYVDMSVRSTMSSLFTGSSPYNSDYNGWYVKSGYRFCKYFEGSISYSRLKGQDPQSDFRPFELNEQKDTAVSLRFDISQNLIFKVEQHFIKGGLGIFVSENPDGVEDSMAMTIAKITAYF